MVNLATYILNIDRPALPPKPCGARRILLFSDLHIGIFPRFTQLFDKRLLGALNHFFRRRNNLKAGNVRRLAELLPQIQPDITVCAGDLGSVALDEEFETAFEMLKPFMGDSFIFVPGNHDAYVKASLPTLERVFKRLNGSRWSIDELPISLQINGLRLILINAAQPLPYHLSCGVIDARMQERISELAKDRTLPTIAVCHFPAIEEDGSPVGWRHGLRGGRFMAGLLENGAIDAILSGHTHHPYRHSLPDGQTQLCSGSLTLHGSFALCDILSTN